MVKEMDIAFLAGAKFENKIYFSAMNMNSLFCFDCDTHDVKYIRDFDKESIKECIHSCACLYKDTIWFIPWEGKYIAKVDVKTYQIEYLEIPEFNGYGYRDFVVYKEKYLFLIPSGISVEHLLMVDMDNFTIENCGVVSPKGHAHCAGAFVDGDKINVVSAGGEIYSTYDAITHKVEIVGNAYPSGFQSLLRAADKIILIPKDNDEIRILDLNGQVLDTFSCGNNFYFGVLIGTVAWAFPFDINRKAVCLNLEDKKKKYYEKELCLNKDAGNWLNVRALPSDDSDCWVVTSFGEIWRVNEDFEILEGCILVIDEEEERRILEKKSNEGRLMDSFSGIVNEGNGLATLRNYIYTIENQ